MTGKPRGDRWYTRLLRLYPRDFRDEFGTEMTRLFRDRGRHEPWPRLWAGVLIDLPRTAFSEHFSRFRQDLRHSWRSLRRTPVITATAVLTLTIGVGSATTVFSVVHAVLLSPLPYPDSERIVELFEQNLESGTTSRVSALNYLSWVERSQSFETIGAFNGTALTLTGRGDAERLEGTFVTASFFDVLRVNPLFGRTLRVQDEQHGNNRVVVLSEPFWRRLGGDPRIVGESITLDGERHLVVGIMPIAFRQIGRSQAAGTAPSQIFLPMTIDQARESRGNHTLRVVARLKHGISVERARGEMALVTAAMEQEFPSTNRNWSAHIERVSDTMLDPGVRRSLALALGAVIAVLLMACANVASLMWVRAARRHAELALRTALGAGRARLIRQLLTESGLLAVISGAAAIVAAAAMHPWIRHLLPRDVPRIEEIRLDGTVLAFGLIAAILSAVVFGTSPALRASRMDPSRLLMTAGRASADASRARLRQMLIAAQVALATMLLVGAALLLQGFVRLQRVPLGFDPDGVMTGRISLPASSYPDSSRRSMFWEHLLASLDDDDGLRAAVATSAPFGPGVRATIRPLGARQTDASGPLAAEHIVSRDYFELLSIPLLAGRSFDERDGIGARNVAVVSEKLAREAWPDANPLGQTITRGGQPYEVVGVVGDVRGSDLQGARGGGPDRDPRAAVYFAARQQPQRTMTLLVDAPRDGVPVTDSVRAAMRAIDPAIALQQARPLVDWFRESIATTRLMTWLAVAFGGSALLLASVGIFGVVAYSVASRTREIGVRMAMGASRGRILGLVLGEGMTWAAAGAVAGLTAAFAAAGGIAAILFDVPARDAVTFAVVGVAVVFVSLLACAIPAARAMRVDPTIAMRSE